MKSTYIKSCCIFWIFLFVACKKMIDIKVPFQILVTEKVFSNLEDAKSAVAGMYYTMGQSGLNFSNCASTLFCGMSADELRPFLEGTDNFSQFRNNSITETNPLIYANLWQPAYKVIYNANAIIAQLSQSDKISQPQKDSLLANARFARAFSYFYLVNYFGDVPIVTSIDYKETGLLSRSKAELVYEVIIDDLQKAEFLLPTSYPNGQRIMPTKWAAKTLLSRTYLYQKDWTNAALEADSVINQTSLFTLSTDLTKIFTVTSKEAIWQLASNPKAIGGNVTEEGLRFIPNPSVSQSVPSFYLTEQLLNQFDSTDKRLLQWTVLNNYQSGMYRIPYKYKDGRAQRGAAGVPANEHNTVFRLAELYLIRSEALTQLGKMELAEEELNKIRIRAGISPIEALSKEDLLSAIYVENQREFFAEWGHRWMDLKRWGLADPVLKSVKGDNWQKTDQLYPIPISELGAAPNLVQNPGY